MYNKSFHLRYKVNFCLHVFNFSASGVAGFAGAVASNPIDVVKVGSIANL